MTSSQLRGSIKTVRLESGGSNKDSPLTAQVTGKVTLLWTLIYSFGQWKSSICLNLWSLKVEIMQFYSINFECLFEQGHLLVGTEKNKQILIANILKFL